MRRNEDTGKLEIGDEAPFFSLKGTDSKIHSLSDFNDSVGFVVIFTSNHCPYAQAYEQRISSLANHFAPEGIAMAAICSNDADSYPEDNFENMVLKSQSMDFAIPYLQDETQDVARAYSAVCTPECFLFDGERRLCYRGLFDDNHNDENSVEKHYLADAIRSLLAGEAPIPAETHAIGCSIKWKQS
jgi:peroxiredoxin